MLHSPTPVSLGLLLPLTLRYPDVIPYNLHPAYR
jgi:hypothetical protein